METSSGERASARAGNAWGLGRSLALPGRLALSGRLASRNHVDFPPVDALLGRDLQASLKSGTKIVG
jgi:hypothetical protein